MVYNPVFSECGPRLTTSFPEDFLGMQICFYITLDILNEKLENVPVVLCSQTPGDSDGRKVIDCEWIHICNRSKALDLYV